MNAMITSPLSAACDTAKRRLRSVKGDPFLFVDWERVVFLHFLLPPELLRPQVPASFELDLHEGRACVSLVALSMRHFRPSRRGSLAWLFRPMAQQRFLNVRTYVRCGGEPGALFLWGWLSRPLGVALPFSLLGLPCGFGALEYEHGYETGALRGTATGKAAVSRFAYRAAIPPDGEFEKCAPGSLAEFALERYTGFFLRGNAPRLFRAWHPPWLQRQIAVTIEDDGLPRDKFPWWHEARLASANFAPGFERVWLGRAHRLNKATCASRTGRRVISAFYEMP